jgi:PAS domain S-box-containing protein
VARGPDGEPVAFEGSLRDITERKRAEVALRESEQRFRELAEASHDGIGIHENGKIVNLNAAFAEILGYEPSELIGADAVAVTIPDCRDVMREAIASGAARSYEVLAARKDGSAVPLEIRSRPITYRGRPARVVALRDITGRKRAEKALENAREELEERVERRMQRGNAYRLTFRELTVLHLAAEGKSDRGIGRQLGISPLTARKHVENILAKMGSTGRTEASVRALREGLLD